MTDSTEAEPMQVSHLNWTFKEFNQFCGQQQFETVVLICGEKQSRKA
jgi:hypothetical protein